MRKTLYSIQCTTSHTMAKNKAFFNGMTVGYYTENFFLLSR